MITAHMEKYSMPVINSMAIYRKQLINTMDSASGILYVHAPAGYGKTTSVTQWIRSNSYAAAWLSLDYYDKTTCHFCRGVLNALSVFADDKTLELVHEVLDSPEFDKSSVKLMLDVLTKFSFKTLPHMFVIDDFHMCDDRTAALVLPLMRSRLPVAFRLTVISRTHPPYEIYDIIIKKMLNEITYKELSFSEKEILAVFQKNGLDLPDYYAKRLYNQTLGWPAALGAVLLWAGGEGTVSLPEIGTESIVDNESLQLYIKSNIYGYWDIETRNILMKTAICDCIDQKLCLKLTEQENSWEVLTRLFKKTGLLMRYKSNTYRYHQLLKDFLLSELEADDVIDKALLYYNAAVYYKDNCDLLCAFDMATKSGDIALVEDVLCLNSNYGYYNIGVESYYDLLDKNIVKYVPVENISKFPRISLGRLFSLFVEGRLDEFNSMNKLVRKCVLNGEINRPVDIILALLLFAIDPFEGSWNVIESFKAVPTSIMNRRTNEKMPSFTLTCNMPFFHRAQRDYTDISPVLDKYLVEAREFLAPVFGPVYCQLELLLEAGVCFERHDLKRAMDTAVMAVNATEGSSPEIRFSSLLLLCEIHRYNGNTVKAESILNETNKMISNTKSFYLDASFDAYVTNHSLYNGDIGAAHKWLELHRDTELPYKFYQSYEGLTTARAFMAVNNIKEAAALLNKISGMSTRYNKNADFMEAQTLLSICLWKLKKNEEAVKCLTQVLIRGYELEVCMPVIKEGDGILPILQKILNRLKMGYDSELLNKSFVNFVSINAKKLAERQKGLLARESDKPISLSKRQAMILAMLSQKLTYKEIAAKLGIKVTSVREHVSKLYGKLGVSNASDAILKASEKGLLEMETGSAKLSAFQPKDKKTDC